MKQPNLFALERPARPRAAADFDRHNIECAHLILADPELHGGADAFSATPT
jgi:hypothetical protein